MPTPLLVSLRHALRENAPLSSRTEPTLKAAIEYALSSTGSLTRAQMMVCAGNAHALHSTTNLQLACVVEYFHLASLLLDDLPCMDNSDMRRGRPTVHRQFNEATAQLASLAFINRAYSLLGLTLSDQPWLVRVQTWMLVDACLGASGILDGQSRDLRFAESDRTAAAAGRVALGKTASLFSLALFLPSLPSLPSARERLLLKRISVYWGLGYQVMDDLQDVLSNPAATGKPTQRDRELHRPNLACVAGVPLAQSRLQRLTALAERSMAELVQIHDRWSYLNELHRGIFLAAVTKSAAA